MSIDAQENLFDDGVAYKTIIMDPPWLESGGGKCKRGADRHYPLLKTKDIPKVILSSGLYNPDPNGCHIYCWVTNNFLPDGLWLLEQLGVRYITNICWIKDKFGLGQYFRGQHELVLFGRYGKTMLPTNRTVPSVFHAPRTRHSKKPEEFYKIVESVSPAPRLDLFARAERAGYDVWGNEIRPS